MLAILGFLHRPAHMGGLAFSQLVTLYVTPVFYTYLDELQDWFASRKKRKLATETASAGQPAPAQA